MDLNSPKISRIIDDWIEEDIGKGDLTSSAITHKIGKAHWIAKDCLLYTSPSPRD